MVRLSRKKSQVAESEEENEEEDKTNPRGLKSVIVLPTEHSWVVVMVSFFQNLLKEGIPLTILLFASVVYSDSVVTPVEKYFIGAVFLGMYPVLSPLSCALVNWYSFRAISIVGPSITSAAMVICYFVQNYFILSLLTLGIVGGFGCSMFYATSKCMPSVWFCNNRGLACQISGIGQGLGILLMPCLVRVVFFGAFHFSLSLSYWLYAGLYIPLIVMGFLVPKLPGTDLHILNSRKSVSTKVKFMDQEAATDLARTMSILEPPLSYFIFKTYHNLMFPRVKDVVKERSLFLLLPDERMMSVAYPPQRSWRNRRKRIPVSVTESSVSFSVLGVQVIHMVTQATVPSYGSRPFYRSDIFYTSNVLHLNIYYRQTTQLDYHMAVTRAISMKDYLQEVNKQCFVFPEAMSRTLITMLHCGIWNNLYFIVLQLGFFFYYIGFYIPFVFVKERAQEFGLDEKHSFYLIYFIGLGDVFGRILALVASIVCCELDHGFILELMLMSQGLMTLASNFLLHFGVQAGYCCFTGVIMGLSTLIKTNYICRATGIFNLTNAIGHEFILQGLGSMIGIIISAHFNKFLGSVTTCFYIAGFSMVISGLVVLPLKKLKRHYRETARDLV